MKVSRRALLALAAAAPTGAARAQDFPSRPVTIIAAGAAGGPTDTITRILADNMGRHLGQPVVVESIGGSIVGPQRLAQARPDGYTVMVNNIGMAASATLFRRLPYDVPGSFAPLGLVSDAAMTMIARPGFPAADLAGYMEALRRERDKLNLATAGLSRFAQAAPRMATGAPRPTEAAPTPSVGQPAEACLGSAANLCGLLVQQAAGAQATVVVFRGTAPAIAELMAGRIDLLCDQATNTVPYIRDGRVAAFGVSSPQRLPGLPHLPTMAEAGFPSVAMSTWHGMYAPAGTPEPVQEALSAALRAALREERLRARFADLLTEPASEERATPAFHRRFLNEEIARWRPVIQAAGAYAD